MLYNILKVLHIITATLLLMSLAYSYLQWKKTQGPGHVEAVQQIQLQTKLFIIPLSLWQLVSGFYLLSLHHEKFSQLWVNMSINGFFVIIISWFTFIYFLILSQQARIQSQRQDQKQLKYYYRMQFMMLMSTAGTLLLMIFFMANKIS